MLSKNTFALFVCCLVTTGLLFGCNSGSSKPRGTVYLPYDIDKNGTINRFYANDKNSINIEIPASYSIDGEGKIIEGNAYQIKTISEFCFANNNLTKTILIPESIETIGKSAFYNCPNLEKINIPSSVKSIGSDAFEKCPKINETATTGSIGLILPKNDNLTEFNIPSTIIKIGDNVFSGWNSLYKLKINQPITSIGNNAISNCRNLQSAIFNTTLIDLGTGVFANCSQLTSLGKSESGLGIRFTKPQMFKKFIIPESITSIAENMFYGWSKLEEISIPASITLSSLNNVFANNSVLRKLTCACVNVLEMFHRTSEQPHEDETMYIVDHKPYSTSYLYHYYIPKTLEEIHIIGNKTSLENACFYDMKSLKSVYLPNCITSFGRGGFAGCSGLIDVHIHTNCNWTYLMDYYIKDTGTISQLTMNSPSGLAVALKEHNGSEYQWFADNRSISQNA